MSLISNLPSGLWGGKHKDEKMRPSLFGGDLLGESRDTRTGTPGLAGRFSDEQILVPLLTPAVPAVTDQVRVATGLARETGAALSVVNPISVPDQTPK